MNPNFFTSVLGDVARNQTNHDSDGNNEERAIIYPYFHKLVDKCIKVLFGKQPANITWEQVCQEAHNEEKAKALKAILNVNLDQASELRLAEYCWNAYTKETVESKRSKSDFKIFALNRYENYKTEYLGKVLAECYDRRGGIVFGCLIESVLTACQRTGDAARLVEANTLIAGQYESIPQVALDTPVAQDMDNFVKELTGRIRDKGQRNCSEKKTDDQLRTTLRRERTLTRDAKYRNKQRELMLLTKRNSKVLNEIEKLPDFLETDTCPIQ